MRKHKCMIADVSVYSCYEYITMFSIPLKSHGKPKSLMVQNSFLHTREGVPHVSELEMANRGLGLRVRPGNIFRVKSFSGMMLDIPLGFLTLKSFH